MKHFVLYVDATLGPKRFLMDSFSTFHSAEWYFVVLDKSVADLLLIINYSLIKMKNDQFMDDLIMTYRLIRQQTYNIVDIIR